MLKPRETEGRFGRAALVLLLSVLLHGMLALVLVTLGVLGLLRPPSSRLSPPLPVTFLDDATGLQDPRSSLSRAEQEKLEEEKKKEEEEKEVERLRGQIVDIAPPAVERRPDKADYLAEHDSTVERETRLDRFRLDAQIRAPTYGEEDAAEQQMIPDLGATTPSDGARQGGAPFDPGRDGPMASVPAPYQITNKEGLGQSPAMASSLAKNMSGSPSNDLLGVARGDSVNLNAKEVMYAGYINRIKRMVSFYWSQNLDNLPHSVRLSRPSYETVVSVTLDHYGFLEAIEVTHKSSIDPLDQAVVQAFQAAGPFPNPPEQLIAKDGRVYLDDLGFTVQVGQAMAPTTGVDPRAGVQFPGILKATH